MTESPADECSALHITEPQDIGPHSRPVRRRDVSISEFDDSAFLHDLAGEQVPRALGHGRPGLDQSGRTVTIGELAAMVADEFGLPVGGERDDLLGYVRRIAKEGLLKSLRHVRRRVSEHVCRVRSLAVARIRATVFVCPGVIDTSEPLWCEVVDEVSGLDVIPAPWRDHDPTAFRASLNSMPDEDRRCAVEQCRRAVHEQTGAAPMAAQANNDELLEWVAAGHHVGNHTWDHPLLDHCSDEEQRRQITTAREWLQARLPGQPLVFACPNGNQTDFADEVARGIGYQVRLLFDHRVARSAVSGAPISRLRLDRDATSHRMPAIAFGAHVLAFAVRQR